METVKEKTRLLLDDYQEEKDIEIRREIENEIIIINEGLCANIVWKYRNIPLEVEDAMQVARIGMLKAIQTFDGIHQFSTLAVAIITRDLLNVQKSNQRSKRTGVNISFDKLSDDGQPYSDVIPGKEDIGKEHADRMLVREILTVATKALKKREYQVFLFAFGFTDHSRKSIAAELNITAQYVSLIKKDAIKKVRKQFAE